MASVSLVTLLLVFGIHAGRSFANSISSCPTTETIVQDTAGNTFAYCPNSDYQGPSTSIVGNINSQQGCVNYCGQTSGCIKGVYDHVYHYCHVKANDVTWTTSTQFDSMRTYTGAISQCPTTEYSQQDSTGRTWLVCKHSDYQGWSKQVFQNVNSISDCVKLCTPSNGCTQLVYDDVAQSCHLKASTGLTWVGSNRFNTMRLASGTSSGSSSVSSSSTKSATSTTAIASASANCPQGGSGSVLTTSGGSTFSLCPGSDWQGRSVYVLNGFTSNQACAEACSLTPLCKLAVFDPQASVCHMKAPINELTGATSNRFNQINLISKAATVKQAASVGGSWSNIINLPVVPGGAYMVPKQPYAERLLVFSANADLSFGSRTGLTQFADYNYVSGAISARTVSDTGHDMFCPAMSSLQSGKMVVSGGSDAALVSIYDPSTNSFSKGANMNIGRGYESSTILSNGKIFTIGGSFSGGISSKNGETYDPVANSWTLLNGADANAINTQDGAWRRDNHAWLFPWSDGSVFHAGPSRQMNWFTTSGNGGVSGAGYRNTTNDAMCGVNVMYDAGKIFAAGGALVYDDSPGQTTSYLISITKVGQPASVEKIPDMKYSRAFANSAVLPDGTIIVLGGQKRSRQFTDIESTVYPEIFNPKTRTWTVMNAAQVPRNYHSTALLLGDGTVFSGGGGLCYVYNGNDNDWACDPSANHANFEIFTPPYLYNSDGSLAQRPTINQVVTSNDNAGNWVRAGGSLTVNTSDQNGMTFSFIRMGSSTHSVNTDQRRIALTATLNNGAYKIALPSDSGVLLPGFWYLFAMNKAGVPGIARVIQVRL